MWRWTAAVLSVFVGCLENVEATSVAQVQSIGKEIFYAATLSEDVCLICKSSALNQISLS